MLRFIFTLSIILGGTLAVADTWETNWDRPGFDYRDFDLVADRPVVCQWQCQKDPRCVAWTYVKRGIQGKNPRCWLKDKLPRAVRSNCCTSGYIE